MIGKIVKYVELDREAIFCGTVLDKIKVIGDDYYVIQRQMYFRGNEECEGLDWFAAGNGVDKVSPLDVTEVVDKLPEEYHPAMHDFR